MQERFGRRQPDRRGSVTSSYFHLGRGGMQLAISALVLLILIFVAVILFLPLAKLTQMVAIRGSVLRGSGVLKG